MEVAMGTGEPSLEGWLRRTRTSKPAGRRAATAVLFIASCLGALATMLVLSARTDPPRLAVAASAVVDDTGAAQIVEAIDYRYTWSASQGSGGRTGFLHVLSDSGSHAVPRLVDVTADVPIEVVGAPQGNDLAVRVASPAGGRGGPRRASLSGLHGYQMRSVVSLVAPDGHLTWDVLGGGWDDDVSGVAARLVGPWQWETPRCRVAGVAPGFSCTVRQGRDGELVVASHRLPAGARLTVTALRGAGVIRPDKRFVPVPEIGPPDPLRWWSNPPVLGGIVFLSALLPGLALGRVLRRLGRDMVPVGGLDPSIVPGPGGGRSDPGGERVDDTRIASMATPVPEPPQGLEPWQGALLRNEAPDDASRLAWFIGHLAQGQLSFVRERGRDGSEDVVLVRSVAKTTSSDGLDETLDLAFAGRARARIGRPDRDFAAAWRTLEPLQLAWLLDSGLSDPDRARRVRKWRNRVGLVAVPLGILAMFAAIFFGMLGPIGGVALPALAGICGLTLTFVLRVWELNVRTSLGSTWWVRTEAFRRFLSGCGVEDVIGIADRGELGAFTAWAVALDVTEHWTSTVAAAGLPTDTPELDTSLSTPDLMRALRAVVYQADAQAEEGRRSRERRQAARAAKERR
ncbi:MAG TPA: hypothetical protein VFN21_01545 [Acidimicrobiales bacterium]|nr:hypothetical protein [Acidimicrobiales bacterium]